MERVTLTLQGVQLEAALDRARGLVVLFLTEVESAGCTLQPSPAPEAAAPPSPASCSSSDHEEWRPRLRSPAAPSPEPSPSPVRSRSPCLFDGRPTPRPPAAGCPRPERPPVQPSRRRRTHRSRRGGVSLHTRQDAPRSTHPFGREDPFWPCDPGHPDDQPLWPRTGTDLLALRAVPLPGVTFLGTARAGYPPAVAAQAGAPPTLKATPSSRRRLRGSRGSGSRVPCLSPV